MLGRIAKHTAIFNNSSHKPIPSISTSSLLSHYATSKPPSGNDPQPTLRSFMAMPPKPQPHIPEKQPIEGINHIICVSSAKGGVGKSTVAVNLAIALSAEKKRVGLMDADIYGPSVPIMMNLRGRKPDVTETKKLIPLLNYGIKCMSMGFVVDEDTAMIWRGLMVMSAVDQLLRQVQWGDLDILVIDLPPGTGDAQLSICQKVPLAGAVIVSTPQDVALLDVVRGVNMFHKVNVPILGLVENMSYYICNNCGHKEHIFGNEGAKKTAEKMNINFLEDIPLDISIRQTSDAGKPITASEPASTSAQKYFSIAKKVLQQLDIVTNPSDTLKT